VQPLYVDKSGFYDCDIEQDENYWSSDDIASEIWAKFRDVRCCTQGNRTNNYSDNKWIKWVKPGRRNPEFGFIVFVPGLIGRRDFAQFVITVLGRHFRLSCWRRWHGGKTLLDTYDLGLDDDFYVNLNLIAKELTEIATSVDSWTREGILKESFPEKWIGINSWQLFKSLREQAKNKK